MKRWIAALPLAALALLVVLFVGYALKHDPRVNPAALVGKPLPALSLPPLQGGAPVPVRQTIQGPTLVNFFASWCTPCQVEHPALMALKAQGVRIVGVAYRDKPADAQALLERSGDPFVETLADRDGSAGVEFGISGVPETFLVDAGGKVVAKHSGPLDAQSAEALLDRADGAR